MQLAEKLDGKELFSLVLYAVFHAYPTVTDTSTWLLTAAM
jgi:hypothetical protein